MLVLPFTQAFSRKTAREFAAEVLQHSLRVTELHEGENFRFGYQAEGGDRKACKHSAPISASRFASTRRAASAGKRSRQGLVRRMIAEGDVSHARALLGRSFSVSSTPASGRGFGTRYTVPTINLARYSELLPANGRPISLRSRSEPMLPLRPSTRSPPHRQSPNLRSRFLRSRVASAEPSTQ